MSTGQKNTPAVRLYEKYRFIAIGTTEICRDVFVVHFERKLLDRSRNGESVGTPDPDLISSRINEQKNITERMLEVICPFCTPDINEIVVESDYCIFIQTEQPILIGSGLIIPRSHRKNVFDMTEAEWCDTYDLLQRVKALLDERHRPDGYNIGWNSGAVAGQKIFHAHLHIIPRFKDEPLAGRGIRWWIKQEENRRT